MASCSVCGKELSFFAMLGAIRTKRCFECDTYYNQTQKECFATFEQMFTDGGITQGQEQALYQHFAAIRMPQDLAQPVIDRLRYLRTLSEIRWGNIPKIATDIHLNSDEMAHFSMPTTYYKPNKRVKVVPGRFVGTNQKLYFLSFTGSDSMTIDWNNVSKVEMTHISLQNRGAAPAIYITTSKGSGGGTYTVPDPLYTKIMIDALVRIWKRQLVLFREQKVHGTIPAHIKNAVFQRDGGQCIQCGYVGPYIEYDHVVPRSKGGQNTVDNIQLLCRMCNLKKGDRL